jgi:hypothetical protein
MAVNNKPSASLFIVAHACFSNTQTYFGSLPPTPHAKNKSSAASLQLTFFPSVCDLFGLLASVNHNKIKWENLSEHHGNPDLFPVNEIGNSLGSFAIIFVCDEKPPQGGRRKMKLVTHSHSCRLAAGCVQVRSANEAVKWLLFFFEVFHDLLRRYEFVS